MTKKCPECAKFLSEVCDGWICSSCGYEDRFIPEAISIPKVDQEIHDNYWFGTEPMTEEAKEYCDYWHEEAEQ
jgi:hypothetical protein